MIAGPLSDPGILRALEIIFDKLGWSTSMGDVFANLNVETLASAYFMVSSRCLTSTYLTSVDRCTLDSSIKARSSN